MNAEIPQGELPRLLEMHNGDKVESTFSQPEMQRRIKGLRQILVDL